MSELVPVLFAIAVLSRPNLDSNVRKWPASADLRVQQVGGNLGHSGRGANAFGKAPRDPKPPFRCRPAGAHRGLLHW
jgi:hypothetical protein